MPVKALPQSAHRSSIQRHWIEYASTHVARLVVVADDQLARVHPGPVSDLAVARPQRVRQAKARRDRGGSNVGGGEVVGQVRKDSVEQLPELAERAADRPGLRLRRGRRPRPGRRDVSGHASSVRRRSSAPLISPRA